VLPIVGREIPVIADEYVDPEFGTGCVKITPAHDPNDYEMAKRHDLQIVNIMNPDATLNDAVPEEFRGLDRYEAREAVVEKMRELKFLSKIDKYTNKVGYSERGHVPIEPLLSEQWYMRMSELIQPAIKAVKDDKIVFYPDRWTKVYFNWMDNIRDWCISRQLWWGHRIPVYYCDECGAYDAYETAPAKCEKCGSTKIRQDEDVLDTWASSWLWPFAVHSWPETDDELKYYYPTDTLVTAPDIIFFWVARMIIAGYEFMGNIPFKKVYFTSTVRDDLGRKMSKSLGNSPDPLDVIAEFGADALRYTIIRLAPMGNDILYSNEKCRLGREFANKVWNAAKFILNAVEGVTVKQLGQVDKDDFDKWLLTRYNETVTKTRYEIDEFRFNDAAITLYDFIWGEFCAWYIEASKVAIYEGSPAQKESKAAVLLHVLEGSLKLLHPFMPFVTEKIFRALPGTPATIMRAEFPKADPHLQFDKERDGIARAQEAVYTVRNIRGENNIPPHVSVKVRIVADDAQISSALQRNEP
jgi:valyl-tRNA synthetase